VGEEQRRDSEAFPTTQLLSVSALTSFWDKSRGKWIDGGWWKSCWRGARADSVHTHIIVESNVMQKEVVLCEAEEACLVSRKTHTERAYIGTCQVTQDIDMHGEICMYNSISSRTQTPGSHSVP
jgi:hypothetical protein